MKKANLKKIYSAFLEKKLLSKLFLFHFDLRLVLHEYCIFLLLLLILIQQRPKSQLSRKKKNSCLHFSNFFLSIYVRLFGNYLLTFLTNYRFHVKYFGLGTVTNSATAASIKAFHSALSWLKKSAIFFAAVLVFMRKKISFYKKKPVWHLQNLSFFVSQNYFPQISFRYLKIFLFGE